MSDPAPQTTALAKPQPAMPKTVKGWLTSTWFKTQVGLCLPKHLTPDRFCRVALTALTRIPRLADCTPESVIKCMMTCSELGIEPDGRRAHLIPFRNSRMNTTECTLIVDYKGLVELANRSGQVANIHADIVCENDLFTVDRGEIKQHVIDFRKPRGEMYAVYALVRMKDGTEKCEVMTKHEVDGIRKRSKSANDGPWVTDYNEMAKKTVFRRASKWITLSPEVQDALDRDADSVLPIGLVSEKPLEIPNNSPDEPEGPPTSDRSTPPDQNASEGQPEAKRARGRPRKTESNPPQQGPGDVQPEPGIEKMAMTGAQAELQKTVLDAGYTFDDFAKWGVDSGNVPDGGSIPGFADVPTSIADRLIRAKQGLINGLARITGRQQPEGGAK